MNLIRKDTVPGEILSMNEKEAIEGFEAARAEERILASDEIWKNRIGELVGMSHTELTK